MNVFKRIKYWWSDTLVMAVKLDISESIEVVIELHYKSLKIRRFRGCNTVWRELPHFRRSSTSMESYLCDLRHRFEYDRANVLTFEG